MRPARRTAEQPMTTTDEPERSRSTPPRSPLRFSILDIFKLILYAAIVLPAATKFASVTTTELWIWAVIMLLFSPLMFAAEIIDWVLGNTRRK